MFITLLHFYSSEPTPAYNAIASALRACSHEVWIGQPDHDGTFVWRDRDIVIGRQPGPSPNRHPRLSYVPFMLRIRRFLQEVKPDVVQITPAYWSWLLAVNMPPRCHFFLDIRTAGAGGGVGIKGWLVDQFARLSWRIASQGLFDHTLFLNQAGALWLLGEYWQKWASIVPLGVDDRFLHFAYPDQPGNLNTPLTFVYAGTISRARNLGTIIYAAALLKAQTTNFKIILVGPDNDSAVAYYRQLIDSQNLQSVIEIVKPVPYAQVPSYLAQFDVALNYAPVNRIQKRQTFMKVLESCALGLPQISTATAPNGEVIIHGINGLLVEDQPTKLAAAMSQFIYNVEWRHQCSKAARQMRKGISWEEVALQYTHVYQQIVDRKRSGAS